MKAATFALNCGTVLMVLALLMPIIPTAYPPEAIRIAWGAGLLGGLYFGAVGLICAIRGE